MRVLGIDPGTAIVGYGIVDYDGRNFKVVDYGCIYTDKDESQEKRIEKIYDELDDIIKKYKPVKRNLHCILGKKENCKKRILND